MAIDHCITRIFAQFMNESAVKSKLPILMYHSISDEIDDELNPYYQLCTSTSRFRDQMLWLSEHGYQTVETSALNDNNSKMASFEDRSLLITFDDGFRDNYTNALPILEEFGFSAIIFLPTAYINSKRRRFKGRDCITWTEVREMRSRGIQFGSHTVNHPELQYLTTAALNFELTHSKNVLEDELQTPIADFAYPYAFPQEDKEFVSRFLEEIQNTGYQTCVTTKVGRNQRLDNPFLLKRLPINSSDDVPLFSAKLRGAYDWIGQPQTIWRKAKRIKRHCLRGA